MRHANNDKIIIKRDADGHWVYFSVRSPDGSDPGAIIDFVKPRLGPSLGATRKELRSYRGPPESALPTYPPLPKVAKNRIGVERDFARTRIAHGIRIWKGSAASRARYSAVGASPRASGSTTGATRSSRISMTMVCPALRSRTTTSRGFQPVERKSYGPAMLRTSTIVSFSPSPPSMS
jgi:hypothetical protein